MTDEEKNELIDCLKQLMADTLVLKLKTQYFHHHVRGLHFNSLHAHFQELYEDLEEAYDVIGEQIRILGGTAPGSLEGHRKNKNLSSISRDQEYSAEQMVDILFDNNDQIRDLLSDCEKTASDIGAENVLDFFVERHREHDMYHYFLGSLSMNL